MLKGFQRFFQRYGLVVPALGLGVIIIALVVVASAPRPAKQPETTAAPAAVKTNPFIVHDAPIAGPATAFQDLEGTGKTLADFKGKALVVNFWATWCAPCIKEMPTLDALQAKLGGPAFQVLAISQDREGAKAARPFVETNSWKNLSFFVEAPGHFARDATLRGLPTSLLINKEGQEVARVEGELDWASPEVHAKLRELLAL